MLEDVAVLIVGLVDLVTTVEVVVDIAVKREKIERDK